MSKRVDHERRRTEIADALLRVAGRRGLHAVGMREVAAEAGVSLRQVQYYFGTKEDLLRHGLLRLADGLTARVAARVGAAGDRPGPHAVIESVLLDALPTDAESRTFHLLSTAYALLSATGGAPAAPPFADGRDVAEDLVVRQLVAARDAGCTVHGLDPRTEAAGLLAMAAGLGTAVLAGRRTSASAAAVLRHHLDRLFQPPTGPRH